MTTTTKQFIFAMVFLLLALPSFGQTDLGFNYQAVARDNTGSPLTNTAINLRFQITEATASGTIVYQETHAPTTNDFGLFNVIIGGGTIEVGTFGAIDWASDLHFLIVELNGSKIDTSRFEAVPYAKVATGMSMKDLVDVSGTATNGQVLKWNGSEWAPAMDNTDDSDTDPTNELQTLSISGTTLSISNGNSITIPSGGTTYTAGPGIDITGTVISNTGDLDGTDDITNTSIAGGDVSGTFSNLSVIRLRGNPLSATAPTNGQVLKWDGSFWVPSTDNNSDNDADPTNELQTLSIVGNTLSITNGNSILVPGSLWSASGNDIYYNTGNVGIGLSSPLYPLHVNVNDDVVFGTDLAFTGSKFFFDASKGALRVGRTNSASVMNDSIAFYSFASGFEPIAEGDYSVALNSQSRVYGNLGFAAGFRTYSDAYIQATFGRYNTRNTGSKSIWNDADPLFVIGNGTSNIARNNAFTLLKNGQVGLNDATPNYFLDMENDDISSRSIFIDHNATSTSSPTQYGVYVDLDKTNTASSTTIYGFYTSTLNAGGTAYGVYGWGNSDASNAAAAYGVRAIADNDNGTGVVYGMYASFFSSTSTGAEYAGYFAGNVFSTGSYLPSDLNLKSDIRPSQSALGKLLQLQISNYSYRTEDFPDMNLPKGTRTGFMAQDVAKLMPELVQKATAPAATEEELEAGATQTTDVHFQAVDYAGMVPYLVKAIQEQQAQIEALKAEIQDLKKKK
ncbi:MAG: tail fiber domain-containing protein [Bacteroidia bacterium]|nr:tail fiber domain-containing protein [Bacteroidia bacterium]